MTLNMSYNYLQSFSIPDLKNLHRIPIRKENEYQ